MEEYFAKYDLLELVCCGAQGSRVTKGNTFLNTCIGKCCTIVMSADKIIINALKVTTCNSLLAIFAGLLSDLLVRGLSLGPLAPFLAAIVSFQIRFLRKLVDFEPYRSAQTFYIFQPCLAAGLSTISLGWTENYGGQTGSLVEKYRQAY